MGVLFSLIFIIAIVLFLLNIISKVKTTVTKDHTFNHTSSQNHFYGSEDMNYHHHHHHDSSGHCHHNDSGGFSGGDSGGGGGGCD